MKIFLVLMLLVIPVVVDAQSAVVQGQGQSTTTNLTLSPCKDLTPVTVYIVKWGGPRNNQNAAQSDRWESIKPILLELRRTATPYTLDTRLDDYCVER